MDGDMEDVGVSEDTSNTVGSWHTREWQGHGAMADSIGWRFIWKGQSTEARPHSHTTT